MARFPANETQTNHDTLPVDLQAIPKPETTQLQWTQARGGLTLHKPKSGLFKGTALALVIWGAMGGTFGTLCALMLAAGLFPGEVKTYIPILFCTVSAIECLGLFLLAWQLANTESTLTINGQGRLATLTLAKNRPIASQQWQWEARELKDVTVGPSGIKSNSTMLYELHVQPQQGKRVGFFRGLPEDELAWAAACIQAQIQNQAQH